MTRKEFLVRTLGFAGAALGASVLLDGCYTASSESTACDDASGLPEIEQKRRKSAKYVSKTPIQGKTCANCEFYVATQQGGACGACKLFAGPVTADGYCDIWVQI